MSPGSWRRERVSWPPQAEIPTSPGSELSPDRQPSDAPLRGNVQGEQVSAKPPAAWKRVLPPPPPPETGGRHWGTEEPPSGPGELCLTQTQPASCWTRGPGFPMVGEGGRGREAQFPTPPPRRQRCREGGSGELATLAEWGLGRDSQRGEESRPLSSRPSLLLN